MSTGRSPLDAKRRASAGSSYLRRRAVSGNVRGVKNHYTPLLWLALLVPVAVGSAQRASSPPAPAAAGVTAKVVAAADVFLKTLSESERAKVTFGFTSPQRTGWSNLPSGIFERKGARLGDLTPPQREAALALVASALSSAGYKKVLDIINGDEVLKNRGGGRTGGRQGAAGTPPAGTPPAGPPPAGAPAGRGRGSVQFGQDEYYIALLGTPSTTTPWLIQFGGHHLAINVTVVGANSVLTPSLPAAQPATYTLNGQTIRPLGNENDRGFALINALTPEQQKQAILNYKVSDLVLGPGNDGKVIQPEGIQGGAALLLPPIPQLLGPVRLGRVVDQPETHHVGLNKEPFAAVLLA